MTTSEPWILPDPAPIDRSSLDRAQRPDLETLYRTEYPALVALAHGLTGRRAVAEELVQEAFVRTHQRWDQVAEMDRPSAWIRRVVINLSTSRARRLVVEARYLAGLRPSEEPPLDAETVEFWRLIRKLPPRQRVVAALYYADDLDTEAIAQILGRATGTVRAQLHTARQQIAREIGDDDPAPLDGTDADTWGDPRTAEDPDPGSATTKTDKKGERT